MGQKVNPTGIRLGITRGHNSIWYADRDRYQKTLLADIKAREFIFNKLSNASISRIEIERPAQTAKITLYTARPGIVIGKKGEDVEKLKKEVAKILGVPVQISIDQPISSPHSDPENYGACVKISTTIKYSSWYTQFIQIFTIIGLNSPNG